MLVVAVVVVDTSWHAELAVAAKHIPLVENHHAAAGQLAAEKMGVAAAGARLPDAKAAPAARATVAVAVSVEALTAASSSVVQLSGRFAAAVGCVADSE